ncbi:hypothetical protein O3Q51_06970 [Cryomorphaceae bacterium 1068]|nr:hypothetical protein [Cryomorphaceae bacterium 1068]
MLNRLFRRKPKGIDWTQIDLELTDSEKRQIELFSAKSADMRIKDVMILGDTGDRKVFKLLQFSILYDQDKNVNFAALKRIHHFKKHPDLTPMLTDMKKQEKWNQYEPYFSMALSRVGLITIEEFEQKINNG